MVAFHMARVSLDRDRVLATQADYSGAMLPMGHRKRRGSCVRPLDPALDWRGVRLQYSRACVTHVAGLLLVPRQPGWSVSPAAREVLK